MKTLFKSWFYTSCLTFYPTPCHSAEFDCTTNSFLWFWMSRFWWIVFVTTCGRQTQISIVTEGTTFTC